MLEEHVIDDNAKLSAEEIHSYMTRVMYNRCALSSQRPARLSPAAPPSPSCARRRCSPPRFLLQEKQG